MRTFAFVFARGGSKGIPRKNLQLLDGKPLLAWSIEMGQSLSEVEQVFVSTEDAEIANIANSFGTEVIKRPKDLAKDTSPEWLAWQHAIEWVQERLGPFDRFLSLPPTAPLRSKDDVQKCLDLLDEYTDVVTTMTPATRSPWFNMVCEDEFGHLKLLVEGNFARRQDAPVGYDMTTVAYVLRSEFVMNHHRLWEGRVKGVVIPNERAIDIDTPMDLE
ncbi:MAG: acylneuraminate cytidylyltransferase family protein, partial [Deltaproteobacteria bacterium]